MRLQQIKGLKLIIFDLDGTLVDAYPAIVGSFNYAMQKLGYPPRAGLVIRRAVGWGDENLLLPFIDSKDLKRALRIYRRHHRRALIQQSRIFTGVRALLRRLKIKGFNLAVASNRPTQFTLILMRHLGLDKYFDYILCADKLKRGKPDPAILKKIIQRFSVNSREAVYVGDMTIDAQAARRAKIRSVIVTTGSSGLTQIKKERPYRIIRRIRELSRLIDSRPGVRVVAG